MNLTTRERPSIYWFPRCKPCDRRGQSCSRPPAAGPRVGVTRVPPKFLYRVVVPFHVCSSQADHGLRSTWLAKSCVCVIDALLALASGASMSCIMNDGIVVLVRCMIRGTYMFRVTKNWQMSSIDHFGWTQREEYT